MPDQPTSIKLPMYRTITQQFGSGFSTHEAFRAFEDRVSQALAQGYRCAGGPFVYVDPAGGSHVTQAVVRSDEGEA